MRDPNRISRFCDELKAIWGSVPDLRFGQLMYVMLSEYNGQTMKDSFYAEDDELLEFFRKFISETWYVNGGVLGKGE